MSYLFEPSVDAVLREGALYMELLGMLLGMAVNTSLGLVPLLDSMEGLFKCPVELMEGMTSVAEDLADVVDELDAEPGAGSGGGGNGGGGSGGDGGGGGASSGDDSEAGMARQLQSLIRLVAAEVPAAVTRMRKRQKEQNMDNVTVYDVKMDDVDDVDEENVESVENVEVRYAKELKKQQFGDRDMAGPKVGRRLRPMVFMALIHRSVDVANRQIGYTCTRLLLVCTMFSSSITSNHFARSPDRPLVDLLISSHSVYVRLCSVLDRLASPFQGGYEGTHYFSAIRQDIKGKVAAKRQKRLIKEIKRLKKDLPLHYGSTICLRVDRTRPFVMQVCACS